MIRVGQGYDVHRFGEGTHIILGGVSIPHTKGLIAHSDGDVLIHALCDALLGAAALGDIGQHFPDSDERYAGADSRELLKQVRSLVRGAGYTINNVDSTIVAQAPKMAPHIRAMRENISHDLNILIKQVNVKATTTENLGIEGRGEGISAQAVVCVELS